MAKKPAKPKKRKNPNPPSVPTMTSDQYRKMLKGEWLPESWK